MSNNAAERELRAVAMGRKNWTLAGTDEGGRRAAAIFPLFATAKLNDIDPQARLADVLGRVPDYPAKRIEELLPRNRRRKIVAGQKEKTASQRSPSELPWGSPAQAVAKAAEPFSFRRVRIQANRPRPANTNPGRPAPAMGPGTPC